MDEVIRAMADKIAQIEADREGYPLSRTWDEIYEDAWEMATAAYNVMRAKLVPVGWLIDHPDYDAPIFDAEASPLTENESDEGFTMQPLYALPEIEL